MRCLALTLAAGCIVAKQSLPVQPDNVTTVALVTGGLPRPIEDVARHPWFAVRRAGDPDWTVYDFDGEHERADPLDNKPYIEPIVQAVWRGDDADRAAACIEANHREIRRDVDRHFWLIPGPNCNTYGDRMLRRCGLHASLPATSIGKDWRGWIGGGITTEGTGVQLETAVLGVKIGLKEGIEVHVLGLSFGVDFWPPAIIVPLGPGRLGFADR
ncbi:MAG TPA: DUF3750 domain-containing protein [Kofleriaceae bacterium]|jgi:hypothetical protein|nr:DUF3750 domain-containing protein [Kofleriaceae bacterium]